MTEMIIGFAFCEVYGLPAAGGFAEGFEPTCGDGGAVVFWDTGGAGDHDCRFFFPCFLRNLSVSTIGVRRRGSRRR